MCSPSAALTSPSSLSLQLKSNVLSFDCHVSKYAVICEQLKAEVRCWWGGQGSVFTCGLLGNRGTMISLGLRNHLGNG